MLHQMQLHQMPLSLLVDQSFKQFNQASSSTSSSPPHMYSFTLWYSGSTLFRSAISVRLPTVIAGQEGAYRCVPVRAPALPASHERRASTDEC